MKKKIVFRKTCQESEYLVLDKSYEDDYGSFVTCFETLQIHPDFISIITPKHIVHDICSAKSYIPLTEEEKQNNRRAEIERLKSRIEYLSMNS